MSNCKQCNNPIESHTGRRAKQFCNDKCRNDFYNTQNKGKNSDKVWRATYEAVLTENKALKLLIKELQGGNPILERGAKELKEADKKLIDVSVASSKRVIAEVISRELGKKSADPNYPVKGDKESPFDFRIRCAEYTESKGKN